MLGSARKLKIEETLKLKKWPGKRSERKADFCSTLLFYDHQIVSINQSVREAPGPGAGPEAAARMI